MAYLVKNNGIVMKSGGLEILGSDFQVQIKELDEKGRTFWAVANAETPDRQEDIVNADGWDFKNYKKNPVGLFAHNYFDHPHFKTNKIKIDKENKQVLFQPEFDTHDKAQVSWNSYKNGFMNSFSVGFLPKEFQYRDEDQPWSGGRNYTKQELLEISAVPVPAHPDANILRSLGVDTVNLIKLGYKSEFEFDETKGLFWFPIADMEAFKDARIFQIQPGIKAVNAIPLYDEKSSSHPAVGYYLDSTIFTKEQAVEWVKKNSAKVTKKFYDFSVSDKGDFVFKLSEEAMEEKDYFELEDTVKICKCGASITDEEVSCAKCSEENKVSSEETVDDDASHMEEEDKGKKKPTDDNDDDANSENDDDADDKDASHMEEEDKGKKPSGGTGIEEDENTFDLLDEDQSKWVGRDEFYTKLIDQEIEVFKYLGHVTLDEFNIICERRGFNNIECAILKAKLDQLDLWVIEVGKDIAENPYPNEHSCRLADPNDFDKFARKNCAEKSGGKCIDVIYGIKDGKSEIQSLRFKKGDWDADAAKKHCAKRKGTFEAASGKEFDTVHDGIVKELQDQVVKQGETIVEMTKSLDTINSTLKEIADKKNLDTSTGDDNTIEFDETSFSPVSCSQESSIEIDMTEEEIKSLLNGTFKDAAGETIKTTFKGILKKSGQID
jgi:HK97 family phage prohead protease